MIMKAESTCLCGSNRISFSGEVAVKFRCHCKDEKYLTGNGFSNNILIPTTELEVLAGALKLSSRRAESGNTITSHFCGDCGSLLYRTSDGYPGMMVIKAGCIDDDGKTNDEYIPDVEIFTKSRSPWIPAVKSAVQKVADFDS